MERKSIGTLIAALRRANGMTQKDLAERLNVSDKAVSRWERDESLPDLTLLPLIADIFHITVDELLRGERKSAAADDGPLEDSAAEQARLRKQMKRVTNAAMSRLRGRMLAVVGVGLLALLGAVICNFGFMRAEMAALVGLLIWAGAAAMLAVFTASALRSMEDEEYGAEDIAAYRVQVIAWGKGIAFALLGILAMIVPFILCAAEADRQEFVNVYMRAGAWFRWSLVCGAALSLCAVCALCFINRDLEKKGLYPVGRHALHRAVAFLLALAMGCTAVAAIIIEENGASAYLQGTTFDRFEDFKDYCESFVEHMEMEPSIGEADQVEQIVEIDGRELTYEEWLNEFYLSEVRDGEGNLIGRIDPTGIASWTFGKSGEEMTFTAYTHADWAVAETRYDAAMSTVAILFVIEPIIALIVWLTGKDIKKKSNRHN